MAELALIRVSKEYDAHRVVDDLSFALQSGAFLTLLGPSGCGKSTTLRIVAGLTPASAGRVVIGSRDVTRVGPAARNIGMVFQSLALFPHMTVEENIGFSLRVQGVSAAERRERVAQTLDLVRMRPFGSRFPSQISGGQRQRVALARAIVFRPDILLLDEPFSALDRKLREEMQQELRALVRRLGVTTVFVTHDQEEAIRLSDRVAVMNDGRIDQFDTPQAVYDRPATAFVADFVGAVNRLAGKCEGVVEGTAQVSACGQTFRVLVERDTTLPKGANVALVIRPERAALASTLPQDRPAVKGRLVSRVFEGAFTVYAVRLDDGETTFIVREALGHSSGASGADLDSDIFVTWNAKDAHVIRLTPG